MTDLTWMKAVALASLPAGSFECSEAVLASFLPPFVPGSMEDMDSVDHPLDWWAVGGYPLVMRETGCTKAQARHAVHRTIREYYRTTHDPRWRPIGHGGYAQLRRNIMAGRMLDNDLR